MGLFFFLTHLDSGWGQAMMTGAGALSCHSCPRILLSFCSTFLGCGSHPQGHSKMVPVPGHQGHSHGPRRKKGGARMGREAEPFPVRRHLLESSVKELQLTSYRAELGHTATSARQVGNVVSVLWGKNEIKKTLKKGKNGNKIKKQRKSMKR